MCFTTRLPEDGVLLCRDARLSRSPSGPYQPCPRMRIQGERPAKAALNRLSWLAASNCCSSREGASLCDPNSFSCSLSDLRMPLPRWSTRFRSCSRRHGYRSQDMLGVERFIQPLESYSLQWLQEWRISSITSFSDPGWNNSGTPD